MFGMSMMELIIIAVIALVLLGPDELPKVARTVGKTLREIQKAGDDLKDTFDREIMSEVKKPTEPPPGAVAKPPRTLASTVRDIQKDIQKAGEDIRKEVMSDPKASSSTPAAQETSALPAPATPAAATPENPDGKKAGAA
jgi:sec-independent protein translocase protein TatB